MLLKIGFRFGSCLVLLFNIGCRSNNLEDCRKQGQVAVLDLSKELHEIHSLEDLVKRSLKIKKKMRRLTALMIKADNYSKSRSHEELQENGVFLASDKLRYEMMRICEEIEGSKSVLEVIQEEMLDKLDLNDRKTKKL